MRNDSTTFNNNGVQESCKTIVFDESHQEICELMFALRSIKNTRAHIQLMGHEKFQLIQVSENQYVLAPVGWELCD